jgi:hypothetical protein
LKITFALKEFKDAKVNAHYVKHFLLRDSRLEVTVVFADSDEKVFVPPKGPGGKFVLDLGPNEIPDAVGVPGPPQKKRIARLAMDFFIPFKHEGKTFPLLKIRQDFSLKELPTNNNLNIDYQLSPFSWRHSSTSALRTANGNVHPLVDLRNLKRNVIGMNALVLDVTELWDYLHQKNWNTQVYKALTDATKVTFKVFAHLGGSAFIWYSVVPSYLAESTKEVSPHIFYSPGDYGEQQNISDNEEKYLLRNPEQFQAQYGDDSDPYNNGHCLLLGYLLPPVDDDRLDSLNPRNIKIDWAIAHRRNVVNFERLDDRPRQIMLKHWDIGAGFERAFYGLGQVKPQQFLLMPQVYGRKGHAVSGIESTPHLKNVTDAIVDVLQTNTGLIGTGKDELVEKDKMILSCYSESGLDLWNSAANNQANIKALIGIEPSLANTKRTAGVVGNLLRNKIKVFIIGRHKGAKKKGEPDLYRPQVEPALMNKIRFLPDDLRILQYPPINPDINGFVKMRVSRVTNKDLDPLMLDDEKIILDDFATRPTPITGKKIIPFIFQDPSNWDDPSRGALVDIYYTHNFALTGGQEMKWDGTQIYGKGAAKVTYRTFFQQAVEEIG